MAKETQVLTLTPSTMVPALRLLNSTGLTGSGKVSMFIWGAPGIGKSAVCKQFATEENMAFIDMRLSQMDPSDLRGIPMPYERGGINALSWSSPVTLPRDLNFNHVAEINHKEIVRVEFLNPLGANHIPYVQKTDVNLRKLTAGTVPILVSKGVDYVDVCLTTEHNHATAMGIIAQNKSLSIDDLSDLLFEYLEPGNLRVNVSGKARGILGLEELNSAPQSVIAACYELLLDRRLGEYELPDDFQIVACGNREGDRGITFVLPSPVRSRLVHVEMVANFEDWQTHAIDAMYHPAVIGYLTHFQGQLSSSQDDMVKSVRGFSAPRTWMFVSDLLKAKEHNEKRGVRVGTDVFHASVNGAIGDIDGQKFCSFYKRLDAMPSPAGILDGTITKASEQLDPQMSFALITAMSQMLKERADQLRQEAFHNNASVSVFNNTEQGQKWHKYADNYVKFSMENFKTEVCILAIKMAVGQYQLPFSAKSKYFANFAAKYGPLMGGTSK